LTPGSAFRRAELDASRSIDGDRGRPFTAVTFEHLSHRFSDVTQGERPVDHRREPWRLREAHDGHEITAGVLLGDEPGAKLE
jgi:hypothetical protein